MADSYNIFSYTGKEWVQLANISQETIVSRNDKQIPAIIQQLNQAVINEILVLQPKMIKESSISKESRTIESSSDTIEYVMLDILIYRHCTIYLVIQFSSNTHRVRMLAYGTDQIMHNSWGTNLSLATKDLKKNIEESLDNRFRQQDMKTSERLMRKLEKGKYILFIDTP